MLWSIVRPMVDPRTLEKISISGADRTELLEYIDPGFVPRSYGGSDELEVGAAPEEVEFVAYATKSVSFIRLLFFISNWFSIYSKAANFP